MIGGKTKNRSAGYSIIETLVAMSIFVTVATVAIHAFINAVEAQRTVVFEETVSEGVSFALEFMNRQMRTAIPDPDGSCISMGDTFSTSGPGIMTFLNAEGQCMEFRIDNSTNKLRFTSDASVPPGSREYVDLISSDLVSIDDFGVEMSGHTGGDNAQPRVTLTIEASGVPQGPSDPQDVTLVLQTTISTRLLDS